MLAISCTVAGGTRLIACGPHRTVRPSANRASISPSMTKEMSELRAVPVRRDRAAGFEDIDVDLHLVGLIDERLVGQDVLGLGSGEPKGRGSSWLTSPSRSCNLSCGPI